MTHVSNAPAHGGLPHTEQGADGAVLDVGCQAPQSYSYALLHRQRQAEAGVLSSQAGPQLVAEVEERLPVHAELIQPIRGLEFCHDNPLPPVCAWSGGPGASADAGIGADTSRYHHLQRKKYIFFLNYFPLKYPESVTFLNIIFAFLIPAVVIQSDNFLNSYLPQR